MVRRRTTTKAKAPQTGLKIRIKIPTTTTDEDLSEAALRRLPRSELQKLAKAHSVRANMKSETIIRQLSTQQIPKKSRSAENDLEEGPPPKRLKTEEAMSDEVRPTGSQDAHPSQETSQQTITKDPQPPEAGPSNPRSASPAREAPIALSYDKDLFSSTESEMTEEEQLDFATPVSSRSETPPPANVNDLKRCVTIMQQISAQDITVLDKATDMRETATRLRKKARDVRDLVKAESGRRERMETYFRYWQETGTIWDRKWLYGEKIPQASDAPSNQEAQQLAGSAPGRKPMLLPEELKLKREAIISKQEAEQRQLNALRGIERQGKFSPREGSSGTDDEYDLGEANLPSTGENAVKEHLG